MSYPPAAMTARAVSEACLDDNEVAAFLGGQLTGERMRAIEAHIAQCGDCRQLLSALAQVETAAPGDSIAPTLPLQTWQRDGELARGTRIGRYIVLDWRGAGGMGTVYAAFDPELSRKVALKVLGNAGASPSERGPIRDSLLREAQAMAQLTHPNVVAVHDVGSVDDRVFIAMELVEGMTLGDWLADAPRSQREITEVFAAAGQGLAAAHAAGLIHRDFKPANVLIGDDGRVRVTDFGLARQTGGPIKIDDKLAAAASGSLAPTSTSLAGTPAYMAPELYLGRRADPRADQFSFAVALYEALYREPPFDQLPIAAPEHPGGLAIRAAPPGSRVPSAIRHALARALSAEPDQRYPAMHDLLADLAPPPRRPRPRVAVAIGAAVLAIALIAFGGYALHARRAADERAELVGRMRGLAPELRAQLRTTYMLPRHDIRPARAEIRSKLDEVERLLPTLGDDGRGLGHFVLGEGYRVLGEHERALAELILAQRAGERGAHLDAALGHALGAVYELRRKQIETTVAERERGGKLREIDQRYRDPALAHLRAALFTIGDAGIDSLGYLKALIAFHERRFAEAAERAQAVFAAAPTSYEAGVLEARARNVVGHTLHAAGKLTEAEAEFTASRRTFERVLEIARSDDTAWLEYGELVYRQAIAISRGGSLPVDLERRALDALHTAQEINPSSADGYLREAHVALGQGNVEIYGGRDPGRFVDRALVLAEEARQRNGDPVAIDYYICQAHWERGVWQRNHGIDPSNTHSLGRAACNRAIAAEPRRDYYGMLAMLEVSSAVYDGDHGRDPEPSFERAEASLRAALAIADDQLDHYTLAHLFIRRAHYRWHHGVDPAPAIAQGLATLTTVTVRDAARADTWAAITDLLALRARMELAQHRDIAPTLTEARAALEKAFAAHRTFELAIRARMELAAVAAEAQLASGGDPSFELAGLGADVQHLRNLHPADGRIHRMACRAELISARWRLARRRSAGAELTRAAAAAARARDIDPTDAHALALSAEIELLRGTADRAPDDVHDRTALDRGAAFAERALQIDPLLVSAERVREMLAAYK